MLSCSGESTSAISSPALTVAPGASFIWLTIDERLAEIDHKETEHTEHDYCIGKAHESSGRTPAAFNGIGNIWIEAIDRDIHRGPLLKSDRPRGRDERVVARSHRAATWQK